MGGGTPSGLSVSTMEDMEQTLAASFDFDKNEGEPHASRDNNRNDNNNGNNDNNNNIINDNNNNIINAALDINIAGFDGRGPTTSPGLDESEQEISPQSFLKQKEGIVEVRRTYFKRILGLRTYTECTESFDLKHI